jgi:hypothetical protein
MERQHACRRCTLLQKKSSAESHPYLFVRNASEEYPIEASGQKERACKKSNLHARFVCAQRFLFETNSAAPSGWSA